MEKKITATPRGCDSARIEQVIVTRALKEQKMTPVERSFSIGLLTENCSAKRINQAFKRRYKNETVQGNDDK